MRYGKGVVETIEDEAGKLRATVRWLFNGDVDPKTGYVTAQTGFAFLQTTSTYENSARGEFINGQQVFNRHQRRKAIAQCR